MAGQAVTNISSEAKRTVDSMKSIAATQQSVANNANASSANKVAATGLAAAEGAITAVGTIMGATMKVSESLMMPIFQKLSFLRGLACLPVLKQTDPVMGIDIHNVIIPPSPVVPMPHPYIGLLLRPKDFISCALLSVMPVPPEPEQVSEESTNDEITQANIDKALNIAHMAATMAIGMMGATVKLGDFLPRAVAGTPTKNFPHIPMGTGFSPPFMTVQKNVGHSFLGSLFVNADCDPLSGAVAHLHNDCWDVGVKNLHSEDGIPRVMRFYVPSGIQTSIPQGKPVLVNPIPTPVNPSQRLNKLLKGGLGKLTRKMNQGILNKIAANPKLKKKFGGCPGLTKLSKKYGTGVSHPADVAEGHFYTDNVDFSLPGIIPFTFERHYYSYSDFHGPLGIGWHYSYDMALALDKEEDQAAFRMEDGRTTGFRIPAKGKSDFNRKEKLSLHRTEEDGYYITDLNGLVYRFTDREYDNPYNETESRLLQSISNLNGYSIRLDYHRDGVLKKIVDSAGRDILFENDGRGHITSITIPNPEKNKPRVIISTYEYDSHNRLIAQTDALDNPMRFEYDGSLMTKETWRNNLSWHIRYKGSDTKAKCIEITGDRGLMHYKLEYVASDCTLVTNSLGSQTTYYHKDGLVTKQIEPNGGEYTFRYNQYTELEWTIDPLGNGEGETTDEWGNLVTKTAADGGFIHFKYENYDLPYLPTSATDAVGGKWQWVYDSQGNLIKRIDPIGAVTQFEYTDGLLTTIIGAKGEKTFLEYDLQGNLIKVKTSDEGISGWLYDELGQCQKHENVKKGTTLYTYDILGNIIEIIEPDGNIRILEYDEVGNVIYAKDKDRDIRFTYRGVNKLASRTEYGTTFRFLYDSEDQLKIVENEKGEQYTFKLDAQGDVISETDFNGLIHNYERDIAGKIVKVQKPNKKEVVYGYDSVGRVTKVICNPGGKKMEEEIYEYRKDGFLIKAVNDNAKVLLERDLLGRVTKETCNEKEVISEYDVSGNRTGIISNLGANIKAEYNLMGDLILLSNGGWKTQFERDLFGLETGRILNGGIKTRTDRDRLGRVIGHKIEKNNSKISENHYLWGTNDKLLMVSKNGKETHYEYDQWGNLSKTLFEDGKVEYRNPDIVGNLFERLDRMDRKYSKGGQLIKTENWEYKYDSDGNLIRKKDKRGQTWLFEWSEIGMLEKVKRPDGAEVVFKYDALGRRIEKQFRCHITSWLWDGNVPLHEEKRTITKDFSDEMGDFDNIISHPIITWLFEEGTFRPIAKITDDIELSIITDYLGTPEAMFNCEGEKTWECKLNSYGKVRNYEGQYKTDCPFRYQGQYEDSETGLYYNRFRYYSPDEGIYISQDPIGLMGGAIIFIC